MVDRKVPSQTDASVVERIEECFEITVILEVKNRVGM